MAAAAAYGGESARGSDLRVALGLASRTGGQVIQRPTDVAEPSKAENNKGSYCFAHEGKNLIVEQRFADCRYDRVSGLAAELVRGPLTTVDLVKARETQGTPCSNSPD